MDPNTNTTNVTQLIAQHKNYPARVFAAVSLVDEVYNMACPDNLTIRQCTDMGLTLATIASQMAKNLTNRFPRMLGMPDNWTSTLNEIHDRVDTMVSVLSPSANQVSPQTCLFGIVSIGVYAMTMPSVLADSSSASSLDLLSLYRSSPFVCLMDVVALIISYAYYILIMWARKRHLFHNVESGTGMELTERRDCSLSSSANSPKHKYLETGVEEMQLLVGENTGLTPPITPTNISTKIVIFIITVLPQAIKLFAIKGIAYTQICAAIFLCSSLIGGMAKVLGLTSRKLLHKLWLSKANTLVTTTYERKLERSLLNIWIISFIALFLGDLAFLSRVWYHIAMGVQVQVYNHSKVFQGIWLSVCHCLASIVVLWLLCWIFRLRSPIPPLPGGEMTWVYVWYIAVTFEKISHGPRSIATFVDGFGNLKRTGALMLCAGAVSIGLARFLDWIVKILLRIVSGFATIIVPVDEVPAPSTEDSTPDSDDVKETAVQPGQLESSPRPRAQDPLIALLPPAHIALPRSSAFTDPEPGSAAAESRNKETSDSQNNEPRTDSGRKLSWWRAPRRSIAAFMGWGNVLHPAIKLFLWATKNSGTFALAYGIFSLLTAVSYYMVAFDSKNTVVLKWTSVFG